MTRVIAGSAGGRRLVTPEGMDTRPTTDRCKEALFGVIQFRIAGCSFLDLFAGSGQIGIEALSRGAVSLDCVEMDRRALACIRQNLKALNMQQQSRVWPMSVERALEELSRQGRTFDLIFMDPPYEHGWEEKIGEMVGHLELLSPQGLLIIESSSKTEVNLTSLEKEKEKI